MFSRNRILSLCGNVGATQVLMSALWSVRFDVALSQVEKQCQMALFLFPLQHGDSAWGFSVGMHEQLHSFMNIFNAYVVN